MALAAALIAATLNACGNAAPTNDAGADACATVTGVEACVVGADALCTRLLECCGVSPRPASCTMAWTTVRECRAELAARDPTLDCATQPSEPVCRGPIDDCAAQIRVIACADLLNGTARVNCR